MTMIYYLGSISILAYLSTTLVQVSQLFGRAIPSRAYYMISTLVALNTHGVLLYRLIDTPKGHNLNSWLLLSFTLWLMNLLTLLTSIRQPIQSLCAITYPITAISIGLALSFSSQQILNSYLPLDALIHILISLTAMSLLILASVQALLLWLQHYLLKHHYPFPLLRLLPPLQTMESLLFIIIWSGVVFLSGSLLSGFFFQVGLLTPVFLPKTLLAICAWLLLSSLLMGRYYFGWRGIQVIQWTLTGTLLTFLSYFGTKAWLH